MGLHYHFSGVGTNEERITHSHEDIQRLHDKKVTTHDVMCAHLKEKYRRCNCSGKVYVTVNTWSR